MNLMCGKQWVDLLHGLNACSTCAILLQGSLYQLAFAAMCTGPHVIDLMAWGFFHDTSIIDMHAGCI